jgi:hypothetical protein
MDQLRRIGGEAGVLAGIATVWFFVGLVLVYPSVGLELAHQTNPHKYLPFVDKNEALVWSVNILGGMLGALLTAVLILALTDRFREDEPANTRIAQVIGLFGASATAMGALTKHAGSNWLADLYVANQVGASHALYALNSVVNAFFTFGTFAIGCAVLIVGKLMLKHRRYENAGYLSLLAGAIMILSGLFGRDVLSQLSIIAMIFWLGFSSFGLLQEFGGQFFWLKGRPTRSRRNGRARQAA